MPWVDDVQLGRMIREAVQVAVARSQTKVRVPAVLTGTVEDVDGETGDVVWARLDGQAMASDPTQAELTENPGVIPTTRLGPTTIEEQIRIGFDGSAGASSMRTGIAGVDLTLDVDSTQGIVRFLASETVVGYMDATRWELGVPGESLARLDPLGGLRLRDSDDVLRAQLSAPEGLILRTPSTGVSGVILADDGLIVIDPDTGDRISVTSGAATAAPTPRWASSVSAVDPAGTTHGTPAVTAFGTGDDIDIRFVAASDNSDLGAETWTPPGSYTERSDFSDDGGGITLGTSSATRDPAIASPGVANFTSTESNWSRRNGHSVIVRGGGGTSPSFRAASSGAVVESNGPTIPASLALPTGTATGDMLIAFVAIASSQIPIGWTVPAGWKQLGVAVAGLGTPHVLGSGIWYKQAQAGEPASQSVTINMSAAAFTKVHGTVIAIQDPYTFPGGLDIRRNNRSMPRGLERSVVRTTDTSTFTTSGDTDLDTDNAGGDVDMIAGRTYLFQLLLPRFQWFGGSGPSEWQIRLRKDVTTDIGVFGVFAWPGTLNYGVPVSSSFLYVPTANETVRWNVRFAEVSGDANVQATASATAPRRLDIIDLGATF